MAQYQSSLTGPEIDAALTDMAQHDSEAWAVGTRNGTAVTSLDITYHNNSEYYATQAVGAAARAEAAVPAGTSGAVFFDQSQTLTDAQQAQARTNIGAQKGYVQFGAGEGSAKYYVIFAKAVKVSWGANYHATMFVSGAGNYSGVKQGVYIVEINTRSNTCGMNVQQLVAPYSGTVEFGYYDGGDGYWYFGVKRASYGSSTGVVILQKSTSDANMVISNLGVLDTAPTGWTTVTINS